MKLEPTLRWSFAMALALALGGCQATPSPRASTIPVSNTRLTSAELEVADQSPRVGKAQQALAGDDAGLEAAKPEPRREERRPGGGFSGYK